MERVTLPESQNWDWRIETFITDRIDFGALLAGRYVPVGGKFTCLIRRGALVSKYHKI